jgi:hypothetical protein
MDKGQAMAITRLGLRSANKTQGNEPSGTKIFLVGSDTNIADDIDLILDASLASGGIPEYNESWSVDDTSILVVDKRADAYDEAEGGMEGFWWLVTVEYTSPDTVERALDPRDRNWEWSKVTDKRDIAIAASTFDTSGYVFPGVSAAEMLNLGEGESFVMTNGVPVESGVPRTASRKRISLTKYVDTPNGYSDIGASSWDDLDSFEDKVNSDSLVILDVSYDPWDLLVDSVNYEGVTENGFDVIKVDIELVADKEFKHVFSYPSVGYEETDSTGGLSAITDKAGQTVSMPQTLDLTGAAIPNPPFSPYVKAAILVSGGAHVLKALGTLTLPSSIPT